VPDNIETTRLTLVVAGPELLRLELEGAAAVAAALSVTVPKDWPPGEYDRDALSFFLEQYAELGAEAEGWYAWYAIDRASATLVASAGYFGPPDLEGRVEIGYSVCAEWRRQGIATEVVKALVDHALTRGAGRIVAHTSSDNLASRGALDKNGFCSCASERDGMIAFERAARR